MLVPGRKAAALLCGFVGLISTAQVRAERDGREKGIIYKAATGELRMPQLTTPAGSKALPALSNGVLQSAKKFLIGSREREDFGGDDGPFLGISSRTLGCSDRNPDGNVRVNQDCTYRFQAEQLIKFNPVDPKNLIGGMNDGRIGFNHCAFAFSFDAGKTWGDGVPPFWARINVNPPDHSVLGGPPTFHTYDAASDPALAFDSRGAAFFSCIVFDLADAANAVLVTSAPPGAGGSFYNVVPTTASRFVVAEDNNPFVVHDKQFIAADHYPRSPFRDNVYTTWTVFTYADRCKSTDNPDGFCSSPIYFSKSTDHAVTWSKPRVISGSAPALCDFGNAFDPAALASNCNFDQGSDPIVLPNGDIVVTFKNNNTPTTVNQQLAVVSHDGGETWSPPTRVGLVDQTGEPICNFGGTTPDNPPDIRECIPGPFIRTNDFPRIAVNRSNGHVYVTWQDYRTGEFDIHLSRSLDGGRTWQEAEAPVNPDSGKDHYFPAIDIVSQNDGDDEHGGSGDHVAVSYFRSDRLADENSFPGIFTQDHPGVQTKNSDYVLAGGRGLRTPYAYRRVSPRFPPPDGSQFGFNGDYTGLVVIGNIAHPIWSDTRNVNPFTGFHDEDVFTDAVPVPDGRGERNDD